jgi:hypothetical protein
MNTGNEVPVCGNEIKPQERVKKSSPLKTRPNPNRHFKESGFMSCQFNSI